MWLILGIFFIGIAILVIEWLILEEKLDKKNKL